ncbi:MAG TPA: hypothetical protein VGA50_05670, partial [Kiloniellales bacterium]
LAWMRHWTRVSTADMAAAIRAVGAAAFILSTDLGQTGNPIHPDGYKTFVQELKAEGVSDDDVWTMMHVNPSRLLGLTD